MNCQLYMPLRLSLTSVSLLISILAIALILKSRLHRKKKPILYLLHILCCQAGMTLCAIAFSVVSFTSNELDGYVNTSNQIDKEAHPSAFVLGNIEAFVYKSQQLVNGSLMQTSFTFVALFAYKVHLIIVDKDDDIRYSRLLTGAVYILPAVLVGLIVGLDYNGLCYTSSSEAPHHCYINNVCKKSGS